MITPARLYQAGESAHNGTGSLAAGFSEVQLANAMATLPAPVDEVTSSSREARRGVAFLAYPGATRDGRDFIADAVTRGASAVLFEARDFTWNADWKVPHLGVPDLKAHASQIAGHVYGHPAEALWMTGVTGTNGKTSVSQWIARGFELAGRKSAVIGTIGNGIVGNANGPLQPSDNTTPDAVALQRMLRDYLRAGATTCAMEVSSHGLDQGRVADIKYDVAVFTNLTRDHLDYHGTMERYGEAKARLFDLRGVKHAVINVDDPFGVKLAGQVADRAGVELIRYSMRQNGTFANLAAKSVAVSPSGLAFEVTGEFGAARVESDILGAFNIGNLLAVIGALIAGGLTLGRAAEIAGRLPPVPGRMQTVRVGGKTSDKPLVVVDYAHTPDALEKALSTVAAIVPENGRLISVFGCGGDRDRGKRPQMGAISARYADLTIITSDNPRTEDPQRIIGDIEGGMGNAPYRAIADRQQGIYEALNGARPGDIVVIAGKGHEDYQIIGDTKHHFSDVEVAQEALLAWRGARA
ncbi:MAG: UDP-N-acetylmuramoyl-L-alanyl-D-glutamate--2,6-diaminopimelate ligase [Betaproteobacteria bacterium]